MYLTNPTVIEDAKGGVWVAWSAKNYELLAKNLSRVADQWDSMNKTILYLKSCIIKSREKLKAEPDVPS